MLTSESVPVPPLPMVGSELMKLVMCEPVSLFSEQSTFVSFVFGDTSSCVSWLLLHNSRVSAVFIERLILDR